MRGGGEFAWTLWSMPWGAPTAGEHTVTSRAIDAQGRIQPAMDDPVIANKQTYWESNGQITRHVASPSAVEVVAGFSSPPPTQCFHKTLQRVTCRMTRPQDDACQSE